MPPLLLLSGRSQVPTCLAPFKELPSFLWIPPLDHPLLSIHSKTGFETSTSAKAEPSNENETLANPCPAEMSPQELSSQSSHQLYLLVHFPSCPGSEIPGEEGSTGWDV